MTTLAEKREADSRTIDGLIVMTMDYCAETFGVGACTATGEKSYNTFPTCNDKPNYNKITKDYKFTSSDVPVSMLGFDGPRPYLKKVNSFATEIKDNQTVSAMEVYTFIDEPELFDIDLDPYPESRDSIQGDYWKKWLARNSNWKGRIVTRYEGAAGLAEGAYEKRFVGKISDVDYRKGQFVVTVVDLLSSLNDVYIPEKIECKLAADIDDSSTDIFVSDASVLNDPTAETKYGIYEDEIFSYTTRNTTTGKLSGGERGLFDTTAAAHDAGKKIGIVEYFPPDNPYVHANTVLNLGGIPDANIETANFTALQTDPIEDMNYEAVMHKPRKARDIYFELVGDHLDCKSWQNEDQKFDIAKNLVNEPDRTYHTLTDEGNNIDGSISSESNEEAQKTRIILYTDRTTLGDDSDEDDYGARYRIIDEDAENENSRGEVLEHEVFSIWLHAVNATEEVYDQYLVHNFSRLLLWSLSSDASILDSEVEFKDSDIRTGEYALVTTNKLQEADGLPVTDRIAQIFRRDPSGNKVKLRTLVFAKDLIGYMGSDSGPDNWDLATDAEKREIAFMCDDNGKIEEDAAVYHLY